MFVTEDPKVICVGFQKTGTSSLALALKCLGFEVGEAYTQINAQLDPYADNARETVESIAVEVLANNDAIQDSPCPFVFERLDHAYPGSKFILTWRDPDSWYHSFHRFFPQENNPLRQWMYGVSETTDDGCLFKNVYNRQNDEIRNYFRSRPADFLEMELAAGHGWLELVNFLSPSFQLAFPHENVSNAGQRPYRLQSSLLSFLRRHLP